MIALGGRGGIFNDIGTGKTVVALTTAKRLKVSRTLVVCPLEVAPVWEEQAAQWAPQMTFLDGTIGTVKKRAARLLEHRGRADLLFACGYESFWRKPLREAILKWAPELVIYDEGHRLRGRNAHQTRFAHTLRDKVDHVLALTGTPQPNGPEDLFSIFKAIRPDVYGTVWGDFEDYYLKVTRRAGFPIIYGYKNTEEFEQRLHAVSVRITKAEALDLPDEVDVTVPITLSPRTRKIYDKLAKDAVAEIEALSGETGRALSRIALVNLLRLMQITSGFVKVVDGRELDIGTEKIDTLKGLLADILPRRVVVFCRFTRDVRAAVDACEELGPVFELSGAVTQAERRRQIQRFREVPSGVMVCQVQVAALGIDLTCADVAIFYSVDFDLINYVQSRGRLHRHGQTNKVTHYLLQVRGSVDEKVYASLARKENLAAATLDLSAWRELLTGA